MTLVCVQNLVAYMYCHKKLFLPLSLFNKSFSCLKKRYNHKKIIRKSFWQLLESLQNELDRGLKKFDLPAAGKIESHFSVSI